MFFLAFAARYVLEYAVSVYPGQFWTFNIHNFAVIRCLEYLMGMFLSAVFLAVKAKFSSFPYAMGLLSFLELPVTVGTVYLVIVKDNFVWRRATFVLLFCVLVFFLAFDCGPVSKILSLPPFQWFAKIQFEFFIIHQAIIYTFRHPLHALIDDWNIVSIILFVMILPLAILYRFFLRERVTKWMKNFFNDLQRLSLSEENATS